MRGAVPDPDRHERHPDPDDRQHERQGADRQPTDPERWRVARARPALKVTGAVALATLTAFFAVDTASGVVGAVAALALLTWAVRDIADPVRLTADAAGVTVAHGLTGRLSIGWDRIEGIRVDARSRLGLRSETLEIDTGDTLYLFGASDLGADPAGVADRLGRLRDRHRPATTAPPPE